MTIHVSQEDIQKAVPKNAHLCMIAEGIRRRNKWARYVYVDKQRVAFSDVKKRLRFEFFTPPAAQRQLMRFDDGKPVPPFSFILRKTTSVRAMGWHGQPGHANASRVGKRYAPKGRKREKPCYPKGAYTERVFGLRKWVSLP